MVRFSQRLRWSTSSVVITAIILVFFGTIATHMFYKCPEATILIAVITVLTCLSAMWFMPLKISVDEQELNIAFPFRNKVIRLDEISSVEPRHGSPKKCIRTFACGGFFGYWGRFYSEEFGDFIAYAPDFSNYIILTLKDRQKYLISSPDPERLAEAVKALS